MWGSADSDDRGVISARVFYMPENQHPLQLLQGFLDTFKLQVGDGRTLYYA